MFFITLDMIEMLIHNLISSDIDLSKVIEVRVREGLAIQISDGTHLSKVKRSGKELVATRELLENVIKAVTFNSFYAYEEEFCRGFINYYGSKIAIAGTGVFEGKNLKSFKDITSVTIRIPRVVKGISSQLLQHMDNGEKSALIIGKTATGKTTLLRDLCASIKEKNILAIDERGELNLKIGVLGECVDILSHINKEKGIELGIRGLNPDVIVTDELFFAEEIRALLKAKRAGIAVISTFHGDSLESFCECELFQKGLFERYVILDAEKGKCKIKEIYNARFEKI